MSSILVCDQLMVTDFLVARLTSDKMALYLTLFIHPEIKASCINFAVLNQGKASAFISGAINIDLFMFWPTDFF